VVVICYLNAPSDAFAYALVCGLAMSAVGCISMSSMAHSNVLMVREASKPAMVINLVACGMYCFVLLVNYTLTGKINYIFVLVACMLVMATRNVMLKAKSTSLCAPNARLDHGQSSTGG
jgi:hypothetical protein